MEFLTEARLTENSFKQDEENNFAKLDIGLTYFNLKLKNNFIYEIEIGIDDKFDFEYYHTWHDYQIHCLSFGFFYLYWKGEPILDRK